MVKAQVERFRCVRGRRGRPGDTKATGDSKDQLAIIYAHKWLLSWFTGPLLEERRWYIIYDIVVLNCLFMVDWFSCWFPGSWRRALNIKQTHRSNILIKNNNNNNRTNLKAVFWLLELFVYIQLVTWTRLSSNTKFGNARFEPVCIETPPVSFICLFSWRQVNLK